MYTEKNKAQAMGKSRRGRQGRLLWGGDIWVEAEQSKEQPCKELGIPGRGDSGQKR